MRLVTQFASRRHATLIQIFDEDESFNYRIVDGDAKEKPSPILRRSDDGDDFDPFPREPRQPSPGLSDLTVEVDLHQ